MSQYALIVTSRECRAYDGSVMTPAGERFWVTTDPEGWVEASSSHYRDSASVPGDPKLFPSREAALAFGKRWRGHPWWCCPNGACEAVEIRPRYTQVLAGWESV